MSKEAAAFRHVFLAEKSVANVDFGHNVPRITNSLSIKDILCVGIVGCGIMGIGIAVSSLLAGFRVIIYDISDKSINNGTKLLTAILHSQGRRLKLSPLEVEAIRKKVIFCMDLEKY